MEPEKFLKRLAKAYRVYSLRQLGEFCGVSHELLRKIISTKSVKNIAMSSYEKIDEGLRLNGF